MKAVTLAGSLIARPVAAVQADIWSSQL